MNMAIDEALLISYLDGLSPQTVRLYGWSRPSVTFGYRMEPASVDGAGCGREDVVRRPTGGGVVGHRGCVTVALAGGVSSLSKWAVREGLDPKSVRRSGTLYRAIGSAVRGALSALGVESSAVPESASWSAGPDCFSNPCAYDILSGGRKIYGAAQLRIGGAFLYQGNLLVEEGFDAGGFGGLLSGSLEEVLGWHIEEGGLSAAERDEAERLCREKYGSAAWNGLGERGAARRGRVAARGSR